VLYSLEVTISNPGVLMRVRIYRPSKCSAQSGFALSHQWVVEAEYATPRTAEPIMGWTSAFDTFSELRGRLRFPSREDALAFVKCKGWQAIIKEPSERHVNPRNFSAEFRFVRPQDEERTAFSHKKAG
jgi:hypothetical protein